MTRKRAINAFFRALLHKLQTPDMTTPEELDRLRLKQRMDALRAERDKLAETLAQVIADRERIREAVKYALIDLQDQPGCLEIYRKLANALEPK